MNERTTSGTWYNSVSNPPPFLEGVIKELKSAARRRGAIESKSAALGRMASVAKRYQEAAAAGQLFRFLEMHGVLTAIGTSSKSKLRFNLDRASIVMKACRDGKQVPGSPNVQAPPELADPVHEPTVPEPESTDTQPASEAPETDPLDGLTEEELERMTAPPTVPTEPEPSTDSPSADDASAAETVPPKARARHLLHLTPFEAEVWNAALRFAKPNGSSSRRRFPAPVDGDDLCARWFPESRMPDSAQLLVAFQRFVDYEVFASMGTTSGGMRRTYEIRLDPDFCLIKEIPERREMTLNGTELKLIREFQDGKGPCPKRRGIGLTDDDDGTGNGPICAPGFERVDLSSPGPAVRKAAPKPVPVPTPRKPVTSPDRLRAEREDLRGKIARAKQEIDAYNARLDAIERELKSQADRRRQELVRQQEEIARQLAELDV